jgi:S1-C subfamily serine protease
MLAFCWMSTGCVTGPGLSLNVDSYRRPLEVPQNAQDAYSARAGDVVISDSMLFEVDSMRLIPSFEGTIPGTLGINFHFRIDSCPLLLSYQDERWLYYVAEKGCASAWFNETSVFSEEDHAGIRVAKSNSQEREWFVDNSLYNGLPTRGYARWHRAIRPDEANGITKESATIGQAGSASKWIRYDGASSDFWNFTYFESVAGFQSERKFRIKAQAGEILSVKSARVRIDGVNDQNLQVTILSGFEADVPRNQNSNQDRPPQNTRMATCFAVSPSGLVLTANHVVEGATKFSIKFEGKDPQVATVAQASPASDLALLKVNSSLTDYLPLAPQRSARLGQKVFTIGYPAVGLLGVEPKYSEGTVSALSGIQGEAAFLQISVPIQPGNSGGPLVDEAGQVVGVITSTAAVLGFAKATGALPQNVSWAVKSELASALFDQPVRPRPIRGRDEIIAAVMRATCSITGE